MIENKLNVKIKLNILTIKAFINRSKASKLRSCPLYLLERDFTILCFVKCQKASASNSV